MNKENLFNTISGIKEQGGKIGEKLTDIEEYNADVIFYLKQIMSNISSLSDDIGDDVSDDIIDDINDIKGQIEEVGDIVESLFDDIGDIYDQTDKLEDGFKISKESLINIISRIKKQRKEINRKLGGIKKRTADVKFYLKKVASRILSLSDDIGDDIIDDIIDDINDAKGQIEEVGDIVESLFDDFSNIYDQTDKLEAAF